MRDPECEYFGKCGGCATQHIEYELQLENKLHTLMQILKTEAIEVFTDNEWMYRNRMDLTFHPTGIGFKKKGDWKIVVPVKKCLISNHKLNDLITEVTDYFQGDLDAFNAQDKTGTFRYCIIRTPFEDSSVMFVLNSDSSRIGEAYEKIKQFASKTTAKSVSVGTIKAKSGAGVPESIEMIKGNDILTAKPLGRTLEFSILGFFQNNDMMAEKMLKYVRDKLSAYPTQEGHLLDLYGGVGSFGITSGDLFKSTTIVEVVEPCIVAANRNIELNNMQNAEALNMDAKQLKNLKLKSPLYLITDPPRSGMHPKTIKQINELQPEVIIYVSCNPKQLGKELPKLKGYKMKSAAMFDLFPQTNHMEAVIELTKQD